MRSKRLRGLNKTFHIENKKHHLRMTQFSEIQFPEDPNDQTNDGRKSAKNSKTDIFRRTRKVRNKDEREISQLINNCNEMKVTKLQKSLNKKECQTAGQREFKIDELMNNLENRSRIIKESVKCREP